MRVKLLSAPFQMEIYYRGFLLNSFYFQVGTAVFPRGN